MTVTSWLVTSVMCENQWLDQAEHLFYFEELKHMVSRCVQSHSGADLGSRNILSCWLFVAINCQSFSYFLGSSHVEWKCLLRWFFSPLMSRVLSIRDDLIEDEKGLPHHGECKIKRQTERLTSYWEGSVISKYLHWIPNSWICTNMRRKLVRKRLLERFHGLCCSRKVSLLPFSRWDWGASVACTH